jgi:hypothetical protein
VLAKEVEPQEKKEQGQNRKGTLLFVEKLDTQPTVTPRMIDAQGGMNPDAGVAATSPEMVPEHCVA